jgi:hypothetical protein
MSSASNKRNAQNSGASGDKRQKTSGDTSESGETKQSDVSPESSETKEDGAAARERQGRAKMAESQSKPCIAIIYKKIKRKWVKGKGWVDARLDPIGDPITFSSRKEAGERFGMNRSTIGLNILQNSISKIKGGIHKGQYVMFTNRLVESIMFGGKEIKPPPVKSERDKGHLYVVNGKVCIWSGWDHYNCVEHNRQLNRCVFCGGVSICDCGIDRSQCRICRVQPLHTCTECQHTCTSAAALEEHMRTHTGEKPYHCDHCPFQSATSSHLTRHEGRKHDIGNEQCTKCNKNCYRPRSWIDPETNEYERSCKKCYQDRFGVNIREEQEWSDWLDERFYPKFRIGTNTRVSMCTLIFPDGLYEFEGHMILYVDHLILHWEFDEHHHQGKDYSGDEIRMLKMHGIEKYKGKQWVTVRVNPHGYTHPARKPKPGKEERKELMLNVMKACLTKKWESRTHVVYMFYSKDNRNIAKNISKTMLYDADDVEIFCKN